MARETRVFIVCVTLCIVWHVEESSSVDAKENHRPPPSPRWQWRKESSVETSIIKMAQIMLLILLMKPSGDERASGTRWLAKTTSLCRTHSSISPVPTIIMAITTYLLQTVHRPFHSSLLLRGEYPSTYTYVCMYVCDKKYNTLRDDSHSRHVCVLSLDQLLNEVRFVVCRVVMTRLIILTYDYLCMCVWLLPVYIIHISTVPLCLVMWVSSVLFHF